MEIIKEMFWVYNYFYDYDTVSISLLMLHDIR